MRDWVIGVFWGFWDFGFFLGFWGFGFLWVLFLGFGTAKWAVQYCVDVWTDVLHVLHM